MRRRPGREAGRLRSSGLLGLYVGSGQPGTPARIILYEDSIRREAAASSLEDVIASTLRHEIGHHFGFDDRRLRRLGH